MGVVTRWVELGLWGQGHRPHPPQGLAEAQLHPPLPVGGPVDAGIAVSTLRQRRLIPAPRVELRVGVPTSWPRKYPLLTYPSVIGAPFL